MMWPCVLHRRRAGTGAISQKSNDFTLQSPGQEASVSSRLSRPLVPWMVRRYGMDLTEAVEGLSTGQGGTA